MKNTIKLRNLDEVEKELNIITACKKSQKYDLTIYQIFDFLATSIETSIQSAGLKSAVGVWNKFVGKYKYAKLISSGTYTKANQIFGFPNKIETGDDKSSEIRLKTAITAFRLHSGPFGEHPIYGELDKKQWEREISILCGFLFGYLELEGDERLRFNKEKEAKKEKFEQIKQEQRENSYKKSAQQGREGAANKNQNNNRRWKNKKKNNFKGNKNQGGSSAK